MFHLGHRTFSSSRGIGHGMTDSLHHQRDLIRVAYPSYSDPFTIDDKALLGNCLESVI